jgi:predicted nucleic acid-binding protein
LIRVTPDTNVLTSGLLYDGNELPDFVTPRRLSGRLVRDREDAKIIECARSGHSDWIVTGDGDASLKRYQQTEIVTSSKLVRILKDHGA